MKNYLKHLSVFLLALVLLVALPTEVFAASTSVKGNSVSSDNTNSVVISVKTTKKTSLVFKQTKGTITYQNWATGTNSVDTYGDCFIYVKDNSGKEASKTYDCSLKDGISIPLSANKTYTITISPYDSSRTFAHLKAAGKLKCIAPYETKVVWKKASPWTATIKNASICLTKSVSA